MSSYIRYTRGYVICETMLCAKWTCPVLEDHVKKGNFIQQTTAFVSLCNFFQYNTAWVWERRRKQLHSGLSRKEREKSPKFHSVLGVLTMGPHKDIKAADFSSLRSWSVLSLARRRKYPRLYVHRMEQWSWARSRCWILGTIKSSQKAWDGKVAWRGNHWQY